MIIIIMIKLRLVFGIDDSVVGDFINKIKTNFDFNFDFNQALNSIEKNTRKKRCRLKKLLYNYSYPFNSKKAC